MPGFDGTGPRGMGAMTGGGRGFCNPWGMGANARPYIRFQGRGYGRPYYGAGPAAPETIPFAPSMTREQEIGFLKSQAQEMRNQLEQIEAKIQQIGSEA